MDLNIKALIANSKELRQGRLVGEWVEFPISKDETKELFKRINVKNDDEYDVVAVETNIPGFENYLEDCKSIDALNKLGALTLIMPFCF